MRLGTANKTIVEDTADGIGLNPTRRFSDVLKGIDDASASRILATRLREAPFKREEADGTYTMVYVEPEASSLKGKHHNFPGAQVLFLKAQEPALELAPKPAEELAQDPIQELAQQLTREPAQESAQQLPQEPAQEQTQSTQETAKGQIS